MPFVLWKFQSHSFLFYLHEPTTIHRYCYCYHPAIKRLNATIEKFHSHFENDGPRNINNKLWSIIDEAPQPVIKLDGVCTAAIQLFIHYFIILWESARCLKLHTRFLQRMHIVYGGFDWNFKSTNWFFFCTIWISMPFHMWADEMIFYECWFWFDIFDSFSDSFMNSIKLSTRNRFPIHIQLNRSLLLS